MIKILIVEDDNSIRSMLKLRLELRGHKIEEAINGQIGLEKALANDYDAVLMDMHMPVLDGHNATQKLRQQGYKKLIIAVTASAMHQDTRRAIDSGCDCFIAKPIDENFEITVESIIAQANKT